MFEQQWLAIYRETVRPLYGYMSRRTGGDRALTEDIVQETYLRALGRWDPKALPQTPLAWLKLVARNILIDHLRQRKRGPASVWTSDPPAGPEPGKDDCGSSDLFLAVTSLDRKKAGLLEEFYYDGMSVREIAEKRGLSEKAVEGLLRRARQALKARLPDQGPVGGQHA